MTEVPDQASSSRRRAMRHWITGLVAVAAVIVIAMLAWPYLSVLTDRDELRRIILETGPWAPLVYMAFQFLQVVIAPIPGTVIGLVGGYIFETLWATLYGMVGTTLGFLVVFIVSKRYGRRVMKYFVSPESVAKYDNLATSKGAFAFIAIGFLFPFIPDPILGYIAGTTPISTRVLMIICVTMRIPGVTMTSLVGSQVGQGNYTTVVLLLVGLAIVLVLGSIFYKQISDWADTLYRLAIKDNKRAERERREHRIASDRRKKQRRRKRKALQKRVSRALRSRTKASNKRRRKNRRRS